MVVHDDQLWAHIGGFSYFAMVIILLKGAMSMMVAMAELSANFLSPYLDYWCNVTSLTTLAQSDQKYLVSHDGDGCHTYNISWDNYTDDVLRSWNWTGVDTTQYGQEECQQGWMYDNSTFTQPTATSEWNLVCDNEVVLNLISPIYMTGLFFGSLATGPLSDRFGRLRGTLIFLILHICCGALVVFSPNVWVYMFARSLYGLTLRASNLAAGVLVMELIIPHYRAAVMVVNRVIYCVGVMLMAGIAYAVRHFRPLQFLLILPAILMLSYYWIFPESPRWLLAQGRADDTEKAIRKLARRYRREIPDDVIMEYAYQEMAQADKATKKQTSAKDLFLHPIIRRYTFIVGYNKISTQFIYFAVSLNMGMLVGDIYLNTFLAGAIEIPSLFLVLWSMPRLGRQTTLAVAFIVATLSGAASIIFLLVPGIAVGATVAMIVCRSAAGCAMCAATTFTTELFPTPFRQTAVGTTSALASIFSIVAPFVGGPLTKVWRPLPNVIFTTLSFFSVILVFFLPETLYQRLPETTQDAADLANNEVKRRGLTIISVGGANGHIPTAPTQVGQPQENPEMTSSEHVINTIANDWTNIQDGDFNYVRLEPCGPTGISNPAYDPDRGDEGSVA